MTEYKNDPNLWREYLPKTTSDQNKYDHGYAAILGGPHDKTGATRLAAKASLRIGAGLVSVYCDEEALPIYAASLEAVMTKPYRSINDLFSQFSKTPIDAFLIGPGAGVNEETKEKVLRLLALKKPLLLDADAISVFAEDPNILFKNLHENVVLTPHEGEFARIFNITGSKVERALEAAKLSGAIILLKGAETVIATPQGEVYINNNAPAYLATAGSGDVLAGMILGIMARLAASHFEKNIALYASLMGAYIHGECGNLAGMGLISEDLEGKIPEVLRSLYL